MFPKDGDPAACGVRKWGSRSSSGLLLLAATPGFARSLFGVVALSEAIIPSGQSLSSLSKFLVSRALLATAWNDILLQADLFLKIPPSSTVFFRLEIPGKSRRGHITPLGRDNVFESGLS